MPEVGNMPIPARLVREGVRDMVRVSDARMSGTAFGTVILHVSPEAQAGGPLALVRTGDRIRVSASKARTDASRRRGGTCRPPRRLEARPAAHYKRGYIKLYVDHVTQANTGADLDFLVGKDTRIPWRESH
jgi:dehydratase ilvD1